MNRAIIIFVTNPVLGKIKPSLAETLGNERALEVYLDLLKHTSIECARVRADRFVFYSDELPDTDELFPDSDFIYELQEGHSLGERLLHAFDTVFDMGYTEVLYISSDCPDLSFDLLEKAFQSLSEYDSVIGPTKAGSYYLIGLKEFMPLLFENKVWHSETLFDSTITDLINLGKIWYELPILTDIETEEDLKYAKVKQFYRKIVDQSTLA
jgi:rSAM/selenodomain-associated transferase 1